MPVHAVGCPRFVEDAEASVRVFLQRDWLEVRRVHAMANAAEMVKRQSARDRADQLFIGESVGESTDPLSELELSIPATVQLPTPEPARIGP